MDEAKTRTAESALLRDVVYVLFKRKIPLLLLLALGVFIIGYGMATEVPLYEASAKLWVRRIRLGYEMPAETNVVLKRGEVMNSEVEIITSAAVAEAVVDRLGLATGADRPAAIARLEGTIKAVVPPYSEIIDVSLRHRDPELAARIVNTAVDAYLEIRKRVALHYEAVEYLETEVARARAARDSVAAEIMDLGAETGELVLGVRGQVLMQLKQRFSSKRMELRNEIESLEEDVRAVREWLALGGDMSHVPSHDIYEMGTVRAVHVRLIAADSELAQARARYTQDHPEVQRLEREVAGTEELLREEVEQAVLRQEMRIEQWKAEERAVESTLNELESQNLDVIESTVRRRLLENDLSVRIDMYEILVGRKEQFRITVATDPNLLNVGIVGRATVPVRPARQAVNMKTVAGVFTIIFGILLVFGLEKADNSLERREDVQRFLGLRVLASIPDRRT